MVNDRRHYADTFWFTLFHEIGHILNGDLGLSLKDEAEDDADRYAQAALIPQEKYENFISQKRSYDESTIREFAEEIDQDVGIVYGRLQKDGWIPYTDTYLSKKLRHKYNIVIG